MWRSGAARAAASSSTPLRSVGRGTGRQSLLCNVTLKLNTLAEANERCRQWGCAQWEAAALRATRRISTTTEGARAPAANQPVRRSDTVS